MPTMEEEQREGRKDAQTDFTNRADRSQELNRYSESYRNAYLEERDRLIEENKKSQDKPPIKSTDKPTDNNKN